MADYILCLSCANVIATSGEESLACAQCEWSYDSERYSRLMAVARDAAHFGHIYRERYEHDLRSGGLTRRYSLPGPDAVLQFAVLAVISGIVGNASWDVVKIVAKRAATRFSAVSGARPDTIVDDELLDRLAAHCKNFGEALGGMDPQVRSAVIEEVVVHALADRVAARFGGQIAGGEAFNLPEIEAMLPGLVAQALREIQQRPKPIPADFENLWNRIPRDSSDPLPDE